MVYATGRSIMDADLPLSVRRIRCDHLVDDESCDVFAAIGAAGGGLDVLVNNAWGGYEQMVENGAFTWNAPFWEQPLHRWTSMIDVRWRPCRTSPSFARRARRSSWCASGEG